MSNRIVKINEQIGHIFGELFERELSMKAGVLATIVRVDTTRDLRYTRVFVSAFPEAETGYVMQTLKHEKRTLQHALHQKLVMKQKPHVSFILDTTGRAANKVEILLKEIAEEKQN
jgi:ribosome-binding factor A